MTIMPIIAKLQALATANTEALDVIVAERPGQSEFVVFVNGGLLSDGEDEFVTSDLGAALARAASELEMALTNEV